MAIHDDRNIRRILWSSAAFNAGAAATFAFPGSALGRIAGLPVPVPVIYSAMITYFVILFGGLYAWIARQPTIPRPILAFGAIGKAGVFALASILWLSGEVPDRLLLVAGIDLIFAILFVRWLIAEGTRVHPKAGSGTGSRSASC